MKPGRCEVGGWNQQQCDAWMKRNAADGEVLVLTTQRFFRGSISAATAWNIYVVVRAEHD